MGEVRYTLRQLQYFVAVAEAGTITGAAERCFVSQTAVSLGLADLERALDVQLLIRHRARGVILTTSGKVLLAQARSLFGQAEELQTGAELGASSLSGTLSIGCYTTISPIVMPQLIEDLARIHPAITVKLEEDSQPELQEGLQSARIDVAIVYDRGLSPSLATITLAEIDPHVILPRNHPRAADSAVSLRDLAGEPMILFDVSPSREDWSAMVQELGLDPMVAFRTRSFELTRCLVGRNFGYAVLVQKPRTTETYDKTTVVIRPILEKVAPRRVVAAYPSGMRLPARAVAFIEHAQSAVPLLFDHPG